MRRAILLLLSAAATLTPLFAAPKTQTRVVLSKTYTIDKKYRSMEGPQSFQEIQLGSSTQPELLWITGVKTEIVTPDGALTLQPELMCHVNVDIDPNLHRKALELDADVSSRLVTLSQGQLEMTTPAGFGYPILSNEPLKLTTQVLNLNDELLRIDVKHRVTISFVRDADTDGSMRALLNTAVYGVAPIEAAADEGKSTEHNGTSCMIVGRAPNAMGSDYYDEKGRKLTGHWVVPPGRQVIKTDVTRLLDLPFDTNVHAITVHLHPFAESLELRDLNSEKTIFKSKAQNPAKRIGLTYVDSFASAKGEPLYKSHRYELVATYNNTSKENQDSMAVMYLGIVDPNFARPAVSVPYAYLQTSLGAIKVRLRPDLAPKTVAQFQKMVELGIYNGAYFSRIVPGFVAQVGSADDRGFPLSSSQRAAITKLPLEDSFAHHLRGVLSMARPDEDPNGAETSFSILLGAAPHLDHEYTIFGTVEGSEDVLSRIEELGRSENPIERLQILQVQIGDREGALAPQPDAPVVTAAAR